MDAGWHLSANCQMITDEQENSVRELAAILPQAWTTEPLLFDKTTVSVFACAVVCFMSFFMNRCERE
jgi:hypothetical protein